MKIMFYPSFAQNGNRLILVHRADIQFDDLPEKVRGGFSGVEPELEDVDFSSSSSRWWLRFIPETVERLQGVGYDRIMFSF